jgi:predicted membrane-bound spermidine synthase
MGTLLLELSLTRIFSVVFYYHLAFLAISIALFGMGAGGVFSYIVAGWKTPLFTRLGRLSGINSLLVILALALILAQKSDPNGWSIALIYFPTALPFFLAGTILSLAVSETIEKVDRVYFFDLLGAAAGCLLLLPLLDLFGGLNTVIAAGVLFAVAAAIWHSMDGAIAGRAGSVALALALVAFLTYNSSAKLLGIRYAKGQKLENETFEKWNSFSRIAIAPEKGSGSPTIFIDADASTAIAHFDFDHLTAQQRHDLLEQGPALPYAVRPGAKALIIGPGGGWDVARALASGSHDITGVEINPIIATTIMRRRFASLSGGLYLRPDVHIFEEDGRSFVRRSADKFQVLQATLVDTWASTAAGAFALSENNLYTTDAFRDYLQHLTDDGVAAFTRWGFQPPRESLRLVSLAIEALEPLGENDAWRHVIVGREGSVEGWGARDTVLISRKPFSDADIGRARVMMAAARMDMVYLPGLDVRNEFHDLLRSPNPDQYERSYTFDITPVSDNRPFFFYTVQPRDLWTYWTSASRASADFKINRAVPLLFVLMGVSLVATLLILLLPPLVLGARLPRERGVWTFLLYFLFIGCGYILIEVALIQKFVLFLGHPTYALTVVIFSMLVSSGLGSYASRRVVGKVEGRLIKVLGCMAIGTALLGLALSGLLTALVWLPWPLKAAMTVLLIAPLGFVMGMPFPTGLRRLEEWHAPSVRWAWSLNAAASVLGSVAALVCSIYLGLVQTLVIGGLLYIAALAVVERVRGYAAGAPQPGANRVVLAK